MSDTKKGEAISNPYDLGEMIIMQKEFLAGFGLHLAVVARVKALVFESVET